MGDLVLLGGLGGAGSSSGGITMPPSLNINELLGGRGGAGKAGSLSGGCVGGASLGGA